MYQIRSSSPVKSIEQLEDSLNDSEIFDISLPELSSESSKKCSDSDCSLCDLEKFHQNLHGTNVIEGKKFQKCRSHLHRFFNKSSSSSNSSNSRNSSLLKQINDFQEEYSSINNLCYTIENHSNFNRPFRLENIRESFENDVSFWNLYHIAFNSFYQNLPKNDFEYYKLAEKCALIIEQKKTTK